MKTTKILIGGQALKQLGSDRYTEDVDYLINDLLNKINGEYKNTVWDWKLTGNSGDQLSIQDLKVSKKDEVVIMLDVGPSRLPYMIFAQVQEQRRYILTPIQVRLM